MGDNYNPYILLVSKYILFKVDTYIHLRNKDLKPDYIIYIKARH